MISPTTQDSSADVKTASNSKKLSSNISFNRAVGVIEASAAVS
jgi:hypothetical protein